jgi:hypothetical protein
MPDDSSGSTSNAPSLTRLLPSTSSASAGSEQLTDSTPRSRAKRQTATAACEPCRHRKSKVSCPVLRYDIQEAELIMLSATPNVQPVALVLSEELLASTVLSPMRRIRKLSNESMRKSLSEMPSLKSSCKSAFRGQNMRLRTSCVDCEMAQT